MSGPLTATPENDLLIAKAAGIEVRLGRHDGVCWRRKTDESTEVVPFSPTTDIRDAVEAARAMLKTDLAVAFMDRLWFGSMKRNHDATGYAIIRNIFDEKITLAICEAILAVTGDAEPEEEH